MWIALSCLVAAVLSQRGTSCASCRSTSKVPISELVRRRLNCIGFDGTGLKRGRMTDETDDSSVRVLSGTHRPTAALLPQHRLRAADPGMPTGLLNTRPAPSRLESQRALDWLNF